MSGTKKLLVGGSMAGLVLSLALPVSTLTGTNSPAELSAGVRPEFNKPWLPKNNKSSFTPTKSYPIPDYLKYQREEQRSTASPAPEAYVPPEIDEQTPGNLQSQLEDVYRERDGEESIGEDVPIAPSAPQTLQVQQAAARKEKRSVPDQPERSSGLFGRMYDRVMGRTPEPHRRRRGDEQVPPLEEPVPPVNNVFDPEDNVPLVELPETENAPLADVIIPPQPQPNLLPGMDFSNPESFLPDVAQGDGEANDDPFPLPPLPEGFNSPRPNAAVTSSVPSEQAESVLPGDMLLPPLPEGTEAVAIEGEAAPVEELPLNQEPLAEFETGIPIPPIPTGLPVPAKTQPELTEEIASGDPMREELQEPEQVASQPQGEDADMPKPAGETKSNLPLAPSVVDDSRWEHRRPASSLAEDETGLPRMHGWRSREQRATSQEPNTLDIPDEVRQAELPPSAGQESQIEKYRRIAERGERSGFKGFCPVTLKDQLELEDASPSFRAEFEGQIYYFSSQECLQQFQQDPIRYVPANSGLDLVKFIKEGSEEPGRLDFAVWYQDRLFLFSSQDTMQTFRAEPSRFVGEQ